MRAKRMEVERRLKRSEEKLAKAERFLEKVDDKLSDALDELYTDIVPALHLQKNIWLLEASVRMRCAIQARRDFLKQTRAAYMARARTARRRARMQGVRGSLRSKRRTYKPQLSLV